jgi:hypothetical protein
MVCRCWSSYVSDVSAQAKVINQTSRPGGLRERMPRHNLFMWFRARILTYTSRGSSVHNCWAISILVDHGTKVPLVTLPNFSLSLAESEYSTSLSE